MHTKTYTACAFAREQPVMESVYVDDTVHWYSDTHQLPAEPAAEIEVTRSATKTIRVHSASCNQTEHDAVRRS